MNLIIVSKDISKEYNINHNNGLFDIIDEIEDDFDLNSITNCKYIEKYVLNDNNIKDLTERTNTTNNLTSAKVKMKEIRANITEINIEGKLGDVFGLLKVLGLSSYLPYQTYLMNDIYMINALLRQTNDRYDFNRSLVVRAISSFNGNMNYNTTYDTLRGLKISDLKKILPLAFRLAHGIEFKDAKLDDYGDKLSLSHINEDEFNKIESDILRRIEIDE